MSIRTFQGLWVSLITPRKGIEGVSVIIKGTKIDTATYKDGNYNLSAPETNAVLVSSYVGYVNQKIKVGSAKKIKVSLRPNISNLNEVVVVGYCTPRKYHLTGSVASLKVGRQKKIPIFGTSQLLEGGLSGVQVTQNQSRPGGTVFSIRIRGTNSITSRSEPLS